jgi:hypothetical protein
VYHFIISPTPQEKGSMDQVLQFQFEYTEEITLIVTGMPNEVEEFLFTAGRDVEGDEPVTIRSKAENGDLQIVLVALQNSVKGAGFGR